MLYVIWGIIKVILYILLAIICLLLALALLVVFFPFTYKINVESKDAIKGNVALGWLFYIFYIKIEYNNKEFSTKLKIFGIPISFGKKDKSKVEKETGIKAEDVLEAVEETAAKNVTDEASSSKVSQSGEDNNTETNQSNDEKALEESFERQEEKSKPKKKKIKKKKDNKDSILNKIKLIYAEFKDESNRAAFKVVKSEIIRILKSIRPRKYKADLRFGFEDPSFTGELLGIIALLYPKLKDDVRVIPDFENKVFEGSIYLKGRIVVCNFIFSAIRLLLNKDIKKVIKKLRK